MDRVPEVRNARVGRDDGRPELAIQVDRPKAALLGLSVTGVANSIRTSVGGTQAAFFRESGNEYPIIVRLREEDRGRVEDISDILLSTAQGQVIEAKNLMTVRNQAGPTEIQRKNQERIIRVTAEPEATLSEALAAVNARLSEVSRAARHAPRLRRRSRGAGAGVLAAADDADPRDPARLRRHGVAVRVAARSVHHHVLGAARRDRRRARAQAHGHDVQPAGLHRCNHAGGHRRK